jgi:hypothetical protein
MTQYNNKKSFFALIRSGARGNRYFARGLIITTVSGSPIGDGAPPEKKNWEFRTGQKPE